MALPEPPLDDANTPDPLGTLKRRIRQACGRLVQGQAALLRWEVRVQRAVRIASIVLSSLGSAGVIADKVSNTTPQRTGWAFVGAVVALVFAILLQVLNELRVEQIAADARALHETAALLETRLEMALEEPDPRADVDRVRAEASAVVLKYHRAAPRLDDDLNERADELAAKLIERSQGNWRLPAARPRQVPKPRPKRRRE